jgi:pimeloyl-ACP methyl ester carboxylesterase
MPYVHKKGYAEVNNINLHYIEYKNELSNIILLHGLTANAHAFHGLIEGGLTEHFSVISVDQRGRGLSSKPAFAYSIKDHALDIIGLLDYLEIDKIHICGHSFGGLMATYLAYHYPKRFDKVIILDAAPEMNPKAPEMLAAALSRIDHNFKNFDTFLESVKQAPYITFWDDAMLAYYKADVATSEDGSVESRSNIADITQIAIGVAKEDWKTCFSEMEQHALMVVAIDDYTLNQPLLPTFKAKEILKKMKNAQYVEVDGNHQTMLFGKGALQIVEEIVKFTS